MTAGKLSEHGGPPSGYTLLPPGESCRCVQLWQTVEGGCVTYWCCGKPRRIQLSRAKGWKMPENTVKVDRSTRWGNPFVRGVAGVRDSGEAVQLYRLMLGGYLPLCAGPTLDEMRAARRYVNGQLHRLRGKNLACWCRPGAACHADTLLELANAPTPPEPNP